MIRRRTILGAPLGLLLGGCGTGAPGQEASQETLPHHPGKRPATPFVVGLLTNGTLADSGWNSLAGQGIQRIERELNAGTSYQNAGAPAAEEALRGFARDGCRLVFAHGSEFGDAAKRIAAEYPNTSFVVSSGEVEGPNLASLRFDLGEASYLAGIAAAGLSKRGRAGQIGGESFPPVVQGFRLFERGARTVNPSFATTITYLGNWSDANAAKEKALGMIRSGADILFQNCDAAAAGVIQAAEESRGVLVIGSNADQNELHPDLIAASAVLDVPKTFLSVARLVMSGEFKGGTFRENLASGNVYLALNPRFKSRLSPDVTRRIARAEADLRSGRLKLTAS